MLKRIRKKISKLAWPILLILCLAACQRADDAAFHGGQQTAEPGEDFSGLRMVYAIPDGATDEEIEDAIYKLQEEVLNYSTQAQVLRTGADQIRVDIPGLYESKDLARKLVEPVEIFFIRQYNAQGERNYDIVYGTDDGGDASYYVLLEEMETLSQNGDIILSGEDVKTARAIVQTDALGFSSNCVKIVFTDEGKEKFASATLEAAERRDTIAIWYDGALISVPTVVAAITDGVAQITALDTFEEAQEIATSLRLGTSRIPLTLVYCKTLK